MAGRADRDQQSSGVHGGGGTRDPGGRSTGAAGGAMSQGEQDRIMHGPIATPGPGPQPQMAKARENDYNGPQPGRHERWGLNNPNNPEDPGVANQHEMYNRAADDLQNRGVGGWLRDHLLDMIPGFHQVTPDSRMPTTYNNGIYHDAWSPLAAAADVLGMAAPAPFVGKALSMGAQALSDAAHLKEYTFGGNPGDTGWGPTTHPSQPDTQMPGGPPHDPSGPGGPTNTGGNPMQAFGQTPTPFGPQPTPHPVGAPPPAPVPPTMGAFQIPNHTLPQGYQSLFPDSLSAADKALLYGKALMA